MKLDALKITIGVILVVAVICFVALRPKPLEKYRESKTIGKITINIDVCVEKGSNVKKTARILDDVWQKERDILNRMGNFSQDSDIAKINSSYRNPQRVGEDTIKVINESQRYKKLTDGAFDITVGGFRELWSRSQKENRLPTQQELADVKKVARLSSIKVLLGDRIELMTPGTKVDFEGIVSGFAIDQVIKVLHKRGIKNFLIDASGDMYASGTNCSRKPWTIAIRNPEDSSKISDVIRVSKRAVSTSGAFEKFYTMNGLKFSQLIDPRTGIPEKIVLSATVVAPTATDSDVLATSLCLLEPKEGTALIDSLGKGYASIIFVKDNQGRQAVYKSKTYPNVQISKH